MDAGEKENILVSDVQTVKVLAVDDSRTMLAMIAAHLKGTKFDVVAMALSGQDALEKYQAHRPQVVLLDIVMPEVTGVETLERILDTDGAANVVMVSSIGTEAAVHDCLKMGAKGFLKKPLDKESMLTVLKNVCQEAGVAL
jgi:two-component system, chemotaxis family, chemotaxis protein CheY